MSFDVTAWEGLGLDARRLRFDEPLSKHSSLRIGGHAKLWAEPHTRQELAAICSLASQQGLPVLPVGLGSNSLFDDGELHFVALRLMGELAQRQLVDEAQGLVEVGAGMINAHLVRGLLKEGLIDHEFLVLIPGTFGGAIAMNAGTKEQDLKSILRSVELMHIDPHTGSSRFERVEADALKLRYRHAELPAHAMIVSGLIQARRGDVALAEANVHADKERRNRTQPYRLASVGSTFANPPGDYAGRLIEACGLKGHRIGGAQISELHANFFINDQSASAQDFLRLMALARAQVRRRFDVELTPEVRFVGFDGWQRLAAYELEYMDHV